MDPENRNDRNLLIGIAAAIAVGYLTNWAFGALVAGIVIYKIIKTSDLPNAEGTITPAKQKPFLAKFGDTFKIPTCYKSKQEIKSISCDIDAHSNYDHEVVGESNYRTAIWASIPSEQSSTDRFRLYFVFTLIQENDNEHDKNAVAVKLKGVVGYLPRALAKKYRTWALKQGIDTQATCRGVIVGNKGKDYSIWLDLPL